MKQEQECYLGGVLDGGRDGDLVTSGGSGDNSRTELFDGSLESGLGLIRRSDEGRELALREPLGARSSNLLHAGGQARIVTLKDKGKLERGGGLSSGDFGPSRGDVLGRKVGARSSVRRSEESQSKGEQRSLGKGSHCRELCGVSRCDSWCRLVRRECAFIGCRLSAPRRGLSYHYEDPIERSTKKRMAYRGSPCGLIVPKRH